MRQSSGDVLVPLIPHRVLSLEQALEFCREDECVEVTPGDGPDPQGRAVDVRAREISRTPGQGRPRRLNRRCARGQSCGSIGMG